MRNHRNYRAFRAARALVIEVYRHTSSFPVDEHFGLRSQMRRAAVSVSSNIVEGCGRHSDADFLRFLHTAFASARELDHQVDLAATLGFLTPRSRAVLAPACSELVRILY